MMQSTPVNPEPLARQRPLPPAESDRWKSLLDALLPQRPIELSKQSGMVRLTRSFEPDEDGTVAPIWTKTYQKGSFGDAGQIDLSVFNAWERTLIVKAHEDGLESCYRLYQLTEKGTGLHFGDTPLEQRRTRSTVIKTHHAGADLDLWRLMRPWSRGTRLEHPFVLQQHFLKLVRGVLIALHGFHCKRFVHCDLHPGNIVLPAEVRVLPAAHGEGERYELLAQWEHVKLIDLGYSVHKGIEPPAMPPLALWETARDSTSAQRDADGNKLPSRRMSPHLHGRLLALDAIAAQWPPAERYRRHHWQAQQAQLDVLRSLDWREDLYQLGYWLTRIRDGDDDGSWGGVLYMGDPVDVREVNEFIRDFPDELLAWGTTAELPGMPHVDYIRRIDALLLRLPAAPDHFVLHRREHDSAYKTFLDVRAQGRFASARPAPSAAKPSPDETPARSAEATAEATADGSSDGSAWNHVCILDTAAAYARYLKDWPQGAWVEEARRSQAVCAADEALLGAVAPAGRAARRVVPVAAALAGVALAAWLGWALWPKAAKPEPALSARPGARSTLAKAPAPAGVPEIATLAVVASPAPRDAMVPAASTARVAASASAGPPEPPASVVTAPAAAGIPPIDDDAARMAAYAVQTDAVENSEWWRNGRSKGLSADAEQAAWVQDTMRHARQEHWPRAQFALAGLYCSGAYPALAPMSTRQCGEWLAASLANPVFASALTPPEQRRRMVEVVVTEFDDLVFGYWQGRFHDGAPSADFAKAVLSGLQALQGDYPGLALRAAHVQACYLRPTQRAAARQTLQAVVQRHSGSKEAAQASRWLAQSRTGDYGHCRPYRA